MATSVYFSQRVRSEQDLYEDIIIESLKIYGQDVFYLPRTIVNEDRILGEDVPSRFSASYQIEMYIENTEGFDGEGDLFTKFGVEIRDQATFIVSRRRWENTIARLDNVLESNRPKEGDIIYLPLSNSMFQIMAVEHEQPFYQISNLPTYKLRCELFEYAGEDFDTGIAAVDEVENLYAYSYLAVLDSASNGWVPGEMVSQTLDSGVVISGEVAGFQPATNTLQLIHVGADDGKYHSFVTGKNILSLQGSIASVIDVSELNNLSANEKNLDFETTQDDLGFLDFSETNPFGDPR
jgi:hypothetical protein